MILILISFPKQRKLESKNRWYMVKTRINTTKETKRCMCLKSKKEEACVWSL
jgi:hypothetical protein